MHKESPDVHLSCFDAEPLFFTLTTRVPLLGTLVCTNAKLLLAVSRMHAFMIKNKQTKMTGVGFEPTPPQRLVPKTSALNHSAIQPNRLRQRGIEPRPHRWQRRILTTELLAHVSRAGIEPAT